MSYSIVRIMCTTISGQVFSKISYISSYMLYLPCKTIKIKGLILYVPVKSLLTNQTHISMKLAQVLRAGQSKLKENFPPMAKRSELMIIDKGSRCHVH
jgi:hypothetical protein